MFSKEDIALHIKNQFDQMAHTNYSGFTEWLEAFCQRGELDYERELERFPQPGAKAIPEFEFEEGVEGTLRYPPDSGPLATYENHGWMDNCDMDEYRQDSLYQMVRSKLGIDQPEVLDDIRENTLHILGRCNEPADWGEDKRGLVYGMIQSGKTASMINLIASGMKAGYNLFIVLAGDKSSLRDQSQQRVNDAFNLTNGINDGHKIHSPTWKEDYDGGENYMSAFLGQERLRRNRLYKNVIVIKKNVFLLDRLIADLEGLRNWCRQHHEARGYDFSEDYKCMIIDDEADYASQETDAQGEGSAVHGRLVSLREVGGFRNCYVAYTATPQACLSANTDDCIGYPRDFFWVLEPYMEKDVNGNWRTTSYLGAEQVFNEYDSFLVNKIERDEWPHHERDEGGKYQGVWNPITRKLDSGLQDIEREFLDGILKDQEIKEPGSITTALHSHIITNGVRWFRHWRKISEEGDGLPSLDDVQDSYPYHATMIHLSRVLDHQRKCREVVMRCWNRVIEEWSEIGEDGGGADSEISALWGDQRRRSRALPKTPSLLSFSDVLPFMKLAIEITGLPIRRDDPVNNYPLFEDEGESVSFYLINSGSDGMKLYYSDNDPYQVRTKKSAVFIGGDILSRGLTVEGLSVSYFGRSAGRETGDTVLQRGRWFGHKKNQIDLIQVFIQRQAQLVFRQISIADRELRIQMKQAIRRGLTPMQVLIRLRNSPFFAATSSSKSTFVSNDDNFSFSGDRAVLKEPNFDKTAILRNNRILKAFEKKYSELKDKKLAHNRARMYRDVPIRGVIAFLSHLEIREDAFGASPKRYADFLKDWLEQDGDYSDPPPINIAVMENRRMRRKRFLDISKPTTAEEARANATGQLEAIIGGKGSGGKYKGDYFLDRSKGWHEKTVETPDQTRRAGDPILIVLYGIRPNYLTRSLFNEEETDEHPSGRFVSGKDVMLQEGDEPWYVNHGDSKEEEKKHSVLVFAAFTPNNGPMYNIGTNDLVAAAGLVEEEEDLDVEEDEL